MPDIVRTVFKHLHFPIPLKKDLPSDLISSIELEDIEIRLNRECPRPLITGLITTVVQIPRAFRKIKFLTTDIKAEFYLLHPQTSRRIAKLETDGWHESTSDKRGKLWKIEARVTNAPVDILEGDGFDNWIGMMLRHEGEEMRVSVEGWCSAGIKALKTSAKVQKIPIHARIPKPGQLDPKCQNDLKVLETNPTQAIMTIHILVQNPTPYTLHVEYLHVHLYHDDVRIGEAYVTDTTMLPGSRSRALTKATFLPHANNESKASVATFMKGYASGKKTILEIRLHEKSIPSMPHLSKILAGNFAVKVAIPRLSPDDASNKILETNRPSEDFVPEDGQVGSPSRGLESPIILSATMNILSSTVQLKIFNPLNVPLHVSNITVEASHNGSHIGDLNVPDDFHWTLEPGVQSTPKLHVTWSAISFGLDPKKSLNIVFDGWKRKGEISVDVKGKASVKMGNLELGEMETEVTGIATKIMI